MDTRRNVKKKRGIQWGRAGETGVDATTRIKVIARKKKEV
jgi:hypothetical protein